VLNHSATLKVEVFFDLRFSKSVSRFVQGHLYLLVRGSHDYGPKGREVGANIFVVGGPETMEAKRFFVTEICVSGRGGVGQVDCELTTCKLPPSRSSPDCQRSGPQRSRTPEEDTSLLGRLR
jgi:hypothetical protein